MAVRCIGGEGEMSDDYELHSELSFDGVGWMQID